MLRVAENTKYILKFLTVYLTILQTVIVGSERFEHSTSAMSRRKKYEKRKESILCYFASLYWEIPSISIEGYPNIYTIDL